MTQKGLDVGILVAWTKSFNCSGVVGRDAVLMLNEAIHRRGDLDVDVVAVLNDTTGSSSPSPPSHLGGGRFRNKIPSKQ